MPVTTVCAWCGCEIRVRPCRVKAANFCSKQCSGYYRQGKPFHSEATKRLIGQKAKGRVKGIEQLAAMARQQRRERHPRWRGDAVSKKAARARAQLWFELKPCEICGREPEGHWVHRHHRDHNPHNNAAENIQFLCAYHHKQAHRKKKEEK